MEERDNILQRGAIVGQEHFSFVNNVFESLHLQSAFRTGVLNPLPDDKF